MSNGNSTPVVLAIGGLDPSGGAGIIADVRAIAAAGCKSAAAVTSITFQNSKKVAGAEHLTADAVRRQVLAVLDEHNVAAVKTGMLPTAEIVEAVANLIVEHSLSNLVIDTPLRSTSGFPLIDNDALQAIIERLFPLGGLVTPNIPEAEHLAGLTITSIADIEKAASNIRSLGAGNILIKGGHLPASMNTNAEGHRVSNDFLFHNSQLAVLESNYIHSSPDPSLLLTIHHSQFTNTRGTGCTLASAIAANLALGKDLPESVRTAKSFVYGLIAQSAERTE
jgi:hydroxymethylpyrimidine kinase/phosphomethylpyrimidine kinase